MNREIAYRKLGHAEQFLRNKEVADAILDTLIQANAPLTSKEIFVNICASRHSSIYWCEIERILKALSEGMNKIVIKTQKVDEKPTLINIEVNSCNVKADNNGNFVFRNKMVLANGQVIQGDFTSYFSSLYRDRTKYFVEVPMLINIKRNYWSLIKNEEVA